MNIGGDSVGEDDVGSKTISADRVLLVSLGEERGGVISPLDTFAAATISCNEEDRLNSDFGSADKFALVSLGAFMGATIGGDATELACKSVNDRLRPIPDGSLAKLADSKLTGRWTLLEVVHNTGEGCLGEGI